MTLNQYQVQALKTKQANAAGLLYDAVALAGEAGEVCNEVKKWHRDDNQTLTDRRRDKLRDELGDVLWYVSNMALDLGYTLEEIAEANQRKLEARYAGKAHAEIKVAAIGTEGFSEVGYSPVREFDRDGDAYRYKFDGSH